jgi:putative transposase
VIEEMQAWSNRPLDRVYAAVFIDAIMVKVRDGQVGNRPVYAAIGVDLDGNKDILGMWAGDGGGESAKFWMAVLTDLKNRGVADVFFVVCGRPQGAAELGEHGLADGHGPDMHHLVRGSFRYASRKYWDELSKDLRPIYTATGADAAAAALDALDDKWGKRYPAIIRLWRNAWSESSRSWTTTSRSARSFARRTPSRA